jgi:hypothetical protein
MDFSSVGPLPPAQVLGAVAVAGAAAAAALTCSGGLGRNNAAVGTGKDQEGAAKLITEAVDWAAGHGLLVRSADEQFNHCPVSLLPTPVPRKAFDGAVALGPMFARLVDRIARDTEWLHATLEAAGRGDDFTERLLRISREMSGGAGQQPLQLGILRSDYMLHEPTAGELDGAGRLGKLLAAQGGGQADGGAKHFMQVEINCIASSFGCMGQLATEMHRFLLSRHPRACEAAAPAVAAAAARAERLENAQLGLDFGCPPNNNRAGLPRAIFAAHSE